MEGDSDANYAHYALHKLHKWPSEFMALPMKEKAFVMASINFHVEKEKQARKKAEKK